MAILRESDTTFTLPSTIGGAGGAIKINAKDDARRSTK